ncbi:MAG TPA: ferrochelatase, partial [Bacteroidia bacterium]|nr:ferrochelatase [Bacteroidia bacterium]
CFDTARLLAESLHLSKDKFSVSFQSRLGKDPWIKPYSDHVIKDLAKKGVKKLLVFAPAFTADCLETIYEIGVEYDELFKEHGGAQLQLVESLNDSPEGISLLEKLSK